MTIVEGLESFPDRGAGTDAERRAASWLAEHAQTSGADVRIETFWCRPNWALAHAWHVALAFAGSLITLVSPLAGIVILAIALASVLADAITGVSLGRRLTPERASQNVIVSVNPSRTHAANPSSPQAARLILTANYDAGRGGVAYRLRPVTARLVTALRGLTPGWLGWLVMAIVWLLALAVLREAGHHSRVVGVVQFPPTLALLLGFALLLELGTGRWSPAAGDNGTGVAAALAVASALATAAPAHLAVEVALLGASDTSHLGIRHHLRARDRPPSARWPGRRRRARRDASSRSIVVGIAACAAGAPRWWQSDGALIPLRYSAALRSIAARIAGDEPYLEIAPHRGRGSSAASGARAAGLTSITLGCLHPSGAPSPSHRQTDTSAAIDRQALDRAIQFTLLLIDGIDLTLVETARPPAPSPA